MNVIDAVWEHSSPNAECAAHIFCVFDALAQCCSQSPCPPRLMNTLPSFSSSKSPVSLPQEIPNFFGSPLESEPTSDSYHHGTMQSTGQYTGASTTTSVPDWQHTHPTSLNTLQISSRPLAEATLGELLVKYPIVQELHQSLNVAHHRISLALDTQAALIKDNLRLSDELRRATDGYWFDS